MILRRFGKPVAGVLILAGVLAANQFLGGLDIFAPPNAADAVWLRVLGGEWLVGFVCAGLTAVVLLAVGWWRKRHRWR